MKAVCLCAPEEWACTLKSANHRGGKMSPSFFLFAPLIFTISVLPFLLFAIAANTATTFTFPCSLFPIRFLLLSWTQSAPARPTSSSGKKKKSAGGQRWWIAVFLLYSLPLLTTCSGVKERGKCSHVQYVPFSDVIERAIVENVCFCRFESLLVLGVPGLFRSWILATDWSEGVDSFSEQLQGSYQCTIRRMYALFMYRKKRVRFKGCNRRCPDTSIHPLCWVGWQAIHSLEGRIESFWQQQTRRQWRRSWWCYCWGSVVPSYKLIDSIKKKTLLTSLTIFIISSCLPHLNYWPWFQAVLLRFFRKLSENKYRYIVQTEG